MQITDIGNNNLTISNLSVICICTMSNFGEKLKSQMDSKSLKQSDIARITGFSQGQISRWLSGEQMSVSDTQISALSAAIGDDPINHASLLRAHLLDEMKGLGSHLIRIEIDGPAALNDRPSSRSKAEKALEFLAAERHKNRDLNDLLIDLARCLGAKIDP